MKQSIIMKNKQTSKQIVTIKTEKQGHRSHATLVVLCPWFCLQPGNGRECFEQAAMLPFLIMMGKFKVSNNSKYLVNYLFF